MLLLTSEAITKIIMFYDINRPGQSIVCIMYANLNFNVPTSNPISVTVK
jgi:hypothetical protein